MKYLLKFLKTKKKMLFLIFFALLIQVIGTLTVPYYISQIIDIGIVEKNTTAIISLGIQMLITIVVTAAFALLGSYLCADLSSLVGKHLRERIFEKSQIFSIKDFNHFTTASMITRTTGDIAVIQQTIIMVTQMILPTPILAITALIMTAAINISFLYIPLLTILIFFTIVYFLFKKANPISRSIQGRIDKVNRIVRESLTGIRVIRAFNNTGYEQKRSDDSFTEYADNIIRLNRTFATFNPMAWLLMGITMVAVTWFGGNLVLLQEIQIGSISAVTEYILMMLIYFMMSAMALVMIPRTTACLERIDEVLDTVPEISDGMESLKQSNMSNPVKLTFKNVTFYHKGAKNPVLENLNFVCEKGKTTAIIGGTGSGKSTIAGLMLRLYDAQEGQILLEGHNIQEITQHDHRERISYVPQKAFLFSGTIASNLRLGNSSATLEELQYASKIAQADSFIDSLKDHYDSPVSQAGKNFSGGQKQRLCIARALVKKAPIYIFDDSFSALDFKTDAALRKALKNEVKDSALVIIAQRINTIMDADQIIVLDAGKIVAIGKHEELLKTCEIYKEIADSQFSATEVGN